MPREARFTYRPALDGLRAIAVYLVVAFHAGVAALEGGFIGVDLFFALSGYLITSVLITEHVVEGRINLLRFYSRRLRRLLPAAFAAIAGSSLGLALVYSQLTRSGWVRDAQSALLYFSNWHFIQEARDYFAEAFDKSPFLHFWSLSIEEQFYLFFPLCLIGLFALARRFPAFRPPLGIWALATLSLIAQLIWAQSDSTRAYYGTDTRLYQIAFGALLAFGFRTREPTTSNAKWSTLAPLGLLALLLFASSSFFSWTPSIRGVVATAASIGIIAALEVRPDNWVARALSIRPITYLGRVSYGIYLWHWPVILALTASFHANSDTMFGLSAVLATAMAALSYEMLEMPIRQWNLLNTRRLLVVVTGLLASVTFAVLASPILSRSGRPLEAARTGGASVAVNALGTTVDPSSPVPTEFDLGNDHGVAGVPDRENMHCEGRSAEDCIVHTGKKAHVMLLGDSHAIRLVPAFLQLAREHDFTLSLSAVASCRWQVGLAPEDFREADCYEMRDDLYSRLLSDLRPDLIVTVNVGYAPVGVRDAQFENHSLEELLVETTHLSTTILLEHSREVVMLEPLPIPGFHVKDCLSAARAIGECAFNYGDGSTHPSSRSPLYSTVYRSEALLNPRLTSAPYDHLPCFSGSPCIPIEDGHATMDDAHHVSAPHATRHRERLWQILEPILNRLSDA